MEKKLHHYVPRFYLKAWSHEKLVWCLRNGKIMRPNLRNIAAENQFYKLKDLSFEDVAFIRSIAVNGSPERLKPLHERLLRAFSLPHTVKKSLEHSDNATPAIIADLNETIANVNEDLHTSIEEAFEPYLRAMLKDDLAFYSSPADAATFFRGIAAQYLRTTHLRNGLATLGPERFRIFQRVQNVVVHIYAVNVGFSLYADRGVYKIILLDNHSAIPFITADQPIINISSQARQTIPPERFDLYYPLSPNKAMLLLGAGSKFFPKQTSVDAESAHRYNRLMAAHSSEQIFSASRQYLEVLSAEMSNEHISCDRG